MLGYALPIGKGKFTIWFPEPRVAWGELRNLGDEVTILSPDPTLDTSKIPAMLHDNVYRPSVRMGGTYRNWWVGRLMLWGVIWLIGMDNPVEDIIGGLYLFLGLPLFFKLLSGALYRHMNGVIERFKSLFYSPHVNVVYSRRLAQLEDIVEYEGLATALQALDSLGFAHLREFYRRAVWSERWTTPPPHGAGVLEVGKNFCLEARDA